jgi:sensor c-di-GMP phosphodiesterase-like protein
MQGYRAEMNRSARRKMLRVVGIIMVVMLPVMLALWFAQLRAVSETSAQLRTFAELALDKTELVIQQVDLARDEAEKYQGELCTPGHRQYMLNVVRGRLFVADLIYAEGQNFLCSTVFTPDQPYAIPSLITRVNLTSLSIIIATPHFILAIK